jgi:small subunit ribosomal protein S19
MARIRSILNPAKEGENITVSEARSAFRRLRVGEEGPFVDDNLRKKIAAAKRVGGKIIKTTSRRSTVTPEMVGLTFAVYNGRKFIPVEISEGMVGRMLGDLLGRPGPKKLASANTRNDRKAG